MFPSPAVSSCVSPVALLQPAGQRRQHGPSPAAALEADPTLQAAPNAMQQKHLSRVLSLVRLPEYTGGALLEDGGIVVVRVASSQLPSSKQERDAHRRFHSPQTRSRVRASA